MERGPLTEEMYETANEENMQFDADKLRQVYLEVIERGIEEEIKTARGAFQDNLADFRERRGNDWDFWLNYQVALADLESARRFIESGRDAEPLIDVLWDNFQELEHTVLKVWKDSKTENHLFERWRQRMKKLSEDCDAL